MSLGDYLRALVGILEDAGVPYMVAGSVASAVHGEPRSTQDVDLIVELDSASLGRLLALLPEDRFYVSADAAREALRRRGQFNVIDMDTGWKADLILRKSRPFSVEEFSRRATRVAFGVTLNIASAEDVVLAKLEWAARSGGSERQLRDVRGILAAPGQNLDRVYLERWAQELGVADVLGKLLQE